MRKVLLVGVFVGTSIATISAQPANPNKQFAIIQGKTVTCKEAFDFRDGPLARQHAILFTQTEQQKEAHRQAIIAETNKHIDDLKAAIEAAAKKKKLEIAYALGMQVIAKIVDRYTKAYLASGGLSEVDRKYAEIAIKKATDMQKMLTDVAFQKLPEPKDIIGMPLSVLAVAVPALKPASKTYEIGVFGIDIATLMGDLYLINQDYDVQIPALKKLVADLTQRSNAIKIAEINKVKNDIDAACK